jgi:hypothetical protein
MFFKLMDACGLKRAHFCNTFTLFCRATPRSQRVMLMTSLATQTMLMAKQLQLQHKLAQKPIAPPRALGFTSPWPAANTCLRASIPSGCTDINALTLNSELAQLFSAADNDSTLPASPPCSNLSMSMLIRVKIKKRRSNKIMY